MISLNFNNLFKKINNATFSILSVVSIIFCISIILTTSSCRTTQDGDTKLSAVSDKDYKLSLVKSTNIVTDDAPQSQDQDHHFYEFLVCSISDKNYCVNAFKSDDGSHLAFSVMNFDKLLANVSLTEDELKQIKNQMRAEGIISDVQKAQITPSQMITGSLGIGLGASSAMVVNNLSLYNVDVLNTRLAASSQINQLNDALFISKQVKFKSTDLADVNILHALNNTNINSLEISKLFIERDREYSKIFHQLAGNKHLLTQSDEVVELFSKKTLTVDEAFLAKLQTRIASLKAHTSSLTSTTGRNSRFLYNFHATTNATLDKLEKTVISSLNEDGTINTKKTFQALSTYYSEVVDNNFQLIDRIKTSLDDGFLELSKKLSVSTKLSVKNTAQALSRHAQVLNLWYDKPLFSGSKLSAVGRKIDDAVIVSAQGIKTAGNKASEVAGGIKKAGQSAADNISAQAAKLAKKKLAKPLMIVVAAALAGGVVFGGVKITTTKVNSTSQQQDDSQLADSPTKSDHGQFYKHLHHALSTDATVDQEVKSVDHFIDNLAKFLNTNVLGSEQSVITIQSVCLPSVEGQGKGSCRAVSS